MAETALPEPGEGLPEAPEPDVTPTKSEADEAADGATPGSAAGKKKRQFQKVTNITDFYNPKPYEAQKGSWKGSAKGKDRGKDKDAAEGKGKGPKGPRGPPGAPAEAEPARPPDGALGLAPAAAPAPTAAEAAGGDGEPPRGAKGKLKQGGKGGRGVGDRGCGDPQGKGRGLGGKAPGPGGPGRGGKPPGGSRDGPGTGMPDGAVAGAAPDAARPPPPSAQTPAPMAPRPPAPLGKGTMGPAAPMPGMPLMMQPCSPCGGCGAMRYPGGAVYAMPYFTYMPPGAPACPAPFGAPGVPVPMPMGSPCGPGPCGPGPCGVPGAVPVAPPASRETLKAQVLAQIEYYFSEDNLIKDIYLRSKAMDEEGWVLIQLLAAFKRVQTMTADMSLIVDAVQSSQKLEFDAQNSRVRLLEGWQRWTLSASRAEGGPPPASPPEKPADAGQ